MSLTALTIEVVTEPARFKALRSDWTRLLKQCRQQSVFLQWEWLHTWWQVFAASNTSLRILLLKSGDEYVGLAPFYLQGTGISRGRILRFIGTGELEQDQVVSEYLDIFALPDYEAAAVDAVSDWIVSSTEWRQIRFDDVLGESLCLRLSKNMQQLSHQQNRISGYRYYISLPDSFEEYLQRLSSSRRSRYKRCCKALIKDGADPQGKAIANAPQIDENMRILKFLNHERWRDRAGQGVFESARFLQFHLQLCQLLWPAAQADIKLIKATEKPIAALYVLYSEAVCHYYQSGFTMEGANRYMPLFVSHLNEIKSCIDHNFKRYDFMRGAADSYKKDYACESEPMFTTRIWRHAIERELSNFKGWVRRSAKAVLSRYSQK